MNKYKRLGKNTVLVFIGNAGGKLIGLIMLPFYTKWLNVSDYGITDVIMVYVTFLLPIVSCSIYDSIFIFPKDQDKKIQKKYFSTGLVFSIISLGILSIIFYGLGFVFEYQNITNSFAEYLWLIYALVAASFFQNYMQQFTRSIDKMKVYSLAGIMLPCTLAISSFILIPRYGVCGFIVSQIISYLVVAFCSLIFSGAYKFISKQALKVSYAKEMLKYSIPLIPNGVMWWMVSALNRPLIENYIGLDANGIFAVANKFPGIIVMLFTIFSTSWQISVLEEFKKEGYKQFYNKAFHYTFAFLIGVSCILTIFSKTVISIMADEKFISAWQLVPVLSFAVIFSSIAGFVGVNFSATRESKYYFYSSIWGAGSAILFNFILIPTLGLIGAALAVVISYAVMAISRIIYSWKYVQLENIKNYVCMLGINLFLIFGILYIEKTSLKAILIIILLVVYYFLNKSLLADMIELKRDFLKNYRLDEKNN